MKKNTGNSIYFRLWYWVWGLFFITLLFGVANSDFSKNDTPLYLLILKWVFPLYFGYGIVDALVTGKNRFRSAVYHRDDPDESVQFWSNWFGQILFTGFFVWIFFGKTLGITVDPLSLLSFTDEEAVIRQLEKSVQKTKISLSQPNKANVSKLNSEFINSINMEFVLIHPGKFIMGTDLSSKKGYKDESPPHEVEITHSFFLGRYEVTKRQWVQVMGGQPERTDYDDYPVYEKHIGEILDFVDKLNEIESVSKYRLPTEAEWEYACLSGSQNVFGHGDSEVNLEDYAWYGKSFKNGGPIGVGQLTPNSWGLYDMHGNVAEWVLDSYNEEAYKKHSKRNPLYFDRNGLQVHRGGDWNGIPWHMRCSSRSNHRISEGAKTRGFRLVKML